MKARTHHLGLLCGLLAASFAAGCGEAPLEAPEASTSTVRFDFAGARTSAGIDVCVEIDDAELRTTPRGAGVRTQRQTPVDCGADFTVTVPKGRVEFVGTLSGGQRPLLRGSATERVEKDGFRIVIDLSEIDALELRTRTLGAYGPTRYLYRVAGAEDFETIGRHDTITVAALAGGPRLVTLDPTPCAVVNGPPELDVAIPTDERQLGEHDFEVDCGIGGGLTVEVVTLGSGGPSSYDLEIESESGVVTTTMGVDETRTFDGIGPGPFDALLTVQGPCSVLDDAPAEPFMPVAGAFTITFTIQCASSPSPPPPPPPPPPPVTGSLEIETRSPRPPGPGAVPTFDFEVVDVSGSIVRTGGIGANGTVTVSGLRVSANDHAVTLTATGTCTAEAPLTRSVTIPANGTARVFYETRC